MFPTLATYRQIKNHIFGKSDLIFTNCRPFSLKWAQPYVCSSKIGREKVWSKKKHFKWDTLYDEKKLDLSTKLSQFATLNYDGSIRKIFSDLQSVCGKPTVQQFTEQMRYVDHCNFYRENFKIMQIWLFHHKIYIFTIILRYNTPYLSNYFRN